MVRPVRHKKPVNYSQCEDSDSDDDFISSTAPLNKKLKMTQKELKQDKPTPKLKNLEKEDNPLQEKNPKKGERMALDDKLYKRDLEVALALSVKELPTVTIDVQESQDKYIEKHDNSETETMNKSSHISNCSVASNYFGEDSGGDSDFGESEDDEKFTMRKSKAKEIKKKEVKVKSPVEKKEKKPKSKCNALVTSEDSLPAAIKSKSQHSPEKASLSSVAIRKPLQICSPSAENKRPKWVPPAVSGSSRNSCSPLAGASIKSPSQSLRLGLSRLARVKPLHPNATSS
ncbi:RAD51-associated protein 1 isoform X2 [Tamandua tetradactyla]|uniref:RAD51-associated protein 1 isoform X2 n=1 Tax=Tamandua tetradactyla TaxID=48850 RepID=UPI004054450A